MSLLCVCQRVMCPTKKGPLNERVVDFIKLLETPGYQHVLWELVRESLLQPVICVPLVSRMLGFINLKCNSACSLYTDMSAVL